MKDKGDYKIIIGKKINYKDDKTILKINKDDFQGKIELIEHTIDEALKDLSYSEINLYYNHYYSYTQFGFLKLKLFPIEFNGEDYDGHDFVFETDITKMLKGMLSFYISYQVKMAEEISVASENVLRNQITNMALDRIEEIETEKMHEERKEKLEGTIRKNVENYKRILEGDNL
jgi:F0F1-type ATP synthase gamma subunit